MAAIPAWFIFLLMTALIASGYDFLIKHVSDKINPFLFSALINIVSAIICGSIFLYTKVLNNKNIEPAFTDKSVFVGAIIAGTFVAIMDIGYLMMFRKGCELSIGVPLLAALNIAFTVILGLTLFGEPINIYKVLGIAMAGGSIFLMMK